MRRYRPAIVVLLLAAMATACGDDPHTPPEEDGPQAAAMRLFQVAEIDLDDPESWDRVLETVRAGDRDTASLLDALESLRGVERVRIVEAEALEEPGRWIVDIEGELPGPSLAEFGVEAAETSDGWRVVWFHGPGVEWPGHPSGRDPSLTTSRPPGAPD